MKTQEFLRILKDYVNEIGCLDNELGYIGSHKIVGEIGIDLFDSCYLDIESWCKDGDDIVLYVSNVGNSNLKEFYQGFTKWIEEHDTPSSGGCVVIEYNKERHPVITFDIDSLGGCGCWAGITLVCGGGL